MNIQFKQHQKYVIDYFKKYNPPGVLLYHGLGSGKTITSLGISNLYDNDVVCIVPASMRTQWVSEINKVGVRKSKYEIFSYEEFQKKISDEMYCNNKLIIIDEAHRLRNSGKISKNIELMTAKSFKIILLTGTPMINNPVDFANLGNLIYKDKIFPTLQSKFEEKFMILESKNPPAASKKCCNYSAITCSDNGLKAKNSKYCKYHKYLANRRLPLQKRKDINFKRNIKYEKKQEKRIAILRRNFKSRPKKINKPEFKKFTKCLISYYFPKKSNDYPKTIKKTIKIKMSPEQSNDYIKATKGLDKSDLKNIEKKVRVISNISKFNAFLNKSRRISNMAFNNFRSPKLLAILKKCKEGPKPIIIYSNWLSSGIEPMSKLLNEINLTNLCFTGSKTDSQKKKIVDLYNNKKIDVLLLSSSGAEGLDLKNTRQIHIMEPHWNIAKINQVIGRGIRYKSHISLPLKQRLVNVYYWVSLPKLEKNKTGADEYLYELSNDKINLMEDFMKSLVDNSIETKICREKPKFIKDRLLFNE